MIKKNHEQAISLLLTIAPVLLHPEFETVLHDDDTRKAFATILRHIADGLSEETMSSSRSFKKRKPGYAVEKRSLRTKREGGQ